jgi:hypothetical protein
MTTVEEAQKAKAKADANAADKCFPTQKSDDLLSATDHYLYDLIDKKDELIEHIGEENVREE